MVGLFCLVFNIVNKNNNKIKFFFKNNLIALIFFASRIKEAKIKLTSCSTANFIYNYILIIYIII